jgi:hypothetical protein
VFLIIGKIPIKICLEIITRGIDRYVFTNAPKMFLHFLLKEVFTN